MLQVQSLGYRQKINLSVGEQMDPTMATSRSPSLMIPITGTSCTQTPSQLMASLAASLTTVYCWQPDSWASDPVCVTRT